MKYFHLIIHIDFLGPKIGFEYKGASNFQSIVGAVYSAIITAITIALAGVNWSDFYYRDNPLFALTSQRVVESSTIYLKDFPIVFSLNGMNGNTQYDYINNYMDSEINFGTMKRNGQLDLAKSKIKLEKCDTFKRFKLPEKLKPELKLFQDSRTLYCGNFTTRLIYLFVLLNAIKLDL